MTIRQRLALSRTISVGLAVFLTVIFIAQYFWELRVTRQREVIEKLNRTVSEIMLANSEFIYRPLPRSLGQWRDAHADFDRYYADADRIVGKDEDRAELRRIRIRADDNKRALDLIPLGGNVEYIGQLARNALLNPYENLNSLRKIRNRIEEAQNLNLLASLVLALVASSTVIAVVVVNAFWIQRSVGTGVDAILNGLAEIALGNNAHKIPVAEMDEIGLISDSINDMSSRLTQRTAQLETVNRELEAFCYSISHDLRAPLRHLSGFSELLVRKTEGLDEKGRHYVNVITESASQMGRLIDDLLAFSRMGRAEMMISPVDSSEMVGDVIREISDGENGRVEWNTGELPVIHGDPSMLRQVFVNLIGNAVKFTGGKDAPRIEIRSNRTKSGVVFSVRDNGAGFDPQYTDKLFGVFQRLHRSDEFEGTGIGLANVRRIVSRHGGETWAEGRVGEGATFYFSIPDSAENGRDA